MPHSDTIYFVINKAAGTAMDLSLADRKTVTGNPRNGQDNQRVRFTVTPQFPLHSDLISITMQWRFIKRGDYWVIQNVATDEYLDVEKPGPPVDKEKVVAVKTDTPLTWDVRADGSGDGWQ